MIADSVLSSPIASLFFSLHWVSRDQPIHDQALHVVTLQVNLSGSVLTFLCIHREVRYRHDIWPVGTRTQNL